MEGYDPVSYFDGKPVQGKSSFTYTYKGITYRFFDSANLAKFKTSPGKYEPSYGGWCAYAMGENGEKVKVGVSATQTKTIKLSTNGLSDLELLPDNLDR